MYNHTVKSRLVIKYRTNKRNISHFTVVLNKKDPVLDPLALIAKIRKVPVSNVEILGLSYMK